MRQIVLDTETTGLNPETGHRIIEIGCVELIDRRRTGNNYHQYINPEREIDDGAIAVHGITNEFLADKPVMSEVCAEFLDYVKGGELVIHNADFDTGFIDSEFALQKESIGVIADYCSIVDTLKMARDLHPGQKNNLDALCKRYEVDNSQRDLHGALLDARILADVYLAMTGGQGSLLDTEKTGVGAVQQESFQRITEQLDLPVLELSSDEHAAHEKMMNLIREKSADKIVIWDDQGGNKH